MWCGVVVMIVVEVGVQRKWKLCSAVMQREIYADNPNIVNLKMRFLDLQWCPCINPVENLLIRASQAATPYYTTDRLTYTASL